MSGKLYLCATPIGNLEDITYRVVRTLNEVDVIAAEDTRHSIKLLNHFDIKTPMTSYHEFNKVQKAEKLVERMLAGENVACITDAGTPGISDPGEELARQAIAAGIEVTSLPGACACITALTMSGQKTRRFCFEAFLPRDKKEREAVVDDLKNESRTIVIYEAPHRLLSTVELLKDALGDRNVSVCRELTKTHEEMFQTTFAGILEKYKGQDIKGEFALVIEGKDFEQQQLELRESFEQMSIKEHLKLRMSEGMDKKEAVKVVAKERKIPKNEVYQEAIDL